MINFALASDVVQAYINYRNNLLIEQPQDFNSDKAIKSMLIHPELRAKVLGKAVWDRPTLENAKEYTTSEGHFKIHYTTTGYNAVDSTITNIYNIPDWVYETGKTAERVYRILVDTLKFQPPPPDNNIDGAEIDIFIKNWGGSYYGMTYPEDEVISTSRRYDYTSYMVIDNDYVESGYYTQGFDALHVTVAHEFFHMVQLGYNWWESNDLPGISSSYGDRYFLEWCSVWFEERAYPKVNDYYNYLYDYFYYPSYSMWSNQYWYALEIFLRFILDRYGEELLVKIWDQIKYKYAFQAFEEVMSDENGVELSHVWNEFCRSCYYTGQRFDENLALSSDAKDFPLLEFTYENDFVLIDEVILTTNAEPFATIPFRLTFEKNQFIGIKKPKELNDSFIGSYIFDLFFSNDITSNLSFSNDLFIGEARTRDTLVIFLTNTSINSSYDFNLTVSEFPDTLQIPTKFIALYPNPLRISAKSDFQFDIQLGEILDCLTVYIFDLQGRRILKKKFTAEYLNLGIMSLKIYFNEIQRLNPSSGVYFTVIKAGSKRVVKKFTIIK